MKYPCKDLNSPVWRRVCCWTWESCLNRRSQYVHLYGFSLRNYWQWNYWTIKWKNVSLPSMNSNMLHKLMITAEAFQTLLALVWFHLASSCTAGCSITLNIAGMLHLHCTFVHKNLRATGKKFRYWRKFKESWKVNKNSSESMKMIKILKYFCILPNIIRWSPFMNLWKCTLTLRFQYGKKSLPLLTSSSTNFFLLCVIKK